MTAFASMLVPSASCWPRAHRAAPRRAPTPGAATARSLAPRRADDRSLPAAASCSSAMLSSTGTTPSLPARRFYIALERGTSSSRRRRRAGRRSTSVALDDRPPALRGAARNQYTRCGHPPPSRFTRSPAPSGLKGHRRRSYSETTLVGARAWRQRPLQDLADLKGRPASASTNVEGRRSTTSSATRSQEGRDGSRTCDVLRVSNIRTVARRPHGASTPGVASDPLPVLIENPRIGVRFLSRRTTSAARSSAILVFGPSSSSWRRHDTRFLVGFLKGFRDFLLAAIHADLFTRPLPRWRHPQVDDVPAERDRPVSTPSRIPTAASTLVRG